MRRNLLLGMFAAAGLLFATSCSNDEQESALSGNEGIVTFTLEQQGISTRAYSDGTTATTLTYAVYETGKTTPLITCEDEVTFTDKTATVTLRLAKGKTYDILFWADAPESPYTFSAENQTISVSYDGVTSQDENRDAFFAARTGLEVTDPVSETIYLYRPFAQLNIGTTDAETAAKAGFAPATSEVTVKQLCNTLNLMDGSVSGDKADVTYAMADIPSDETFPVDDVTYLSMNYLLVGSEKDMVDVEFTVANNDNSHSISSTYTNVPVQRNYRTNIYGMLLTAPTNFTIAVDSEYEESDNNINQMPTFASSIAWSDVSSYNSSYSETATINEEADVSILKIGKSSASGTATLTIPSGTKGISFYGVSWNAKPSTMSLTVDGKTYTQNLSANTGATGNSPYTMTVTEDDYYTIMFDSVLTADTSATVTTTGINYRIILWGINPADL